MLCVLGESTANYATIFQTDICMYSQVTWFRLVSLIFGQIIQSWIEKDKRKQRGKRERKWKWQNSKRVKVPLNEAHLSTKMAMMWRRKRVDKWPHHRHTHLHLQEWTLSLSWKLVISPKSARSQLLFLFAWQNKTFLRCNLISYFVHLYFHVCKR